MLKTAVLRRYYAVHSFLLVPRLGFRKSVYVSAESGKVTVFLENGGTLVNEGSLSMPHAHTVSVDPETHLVYFPLENVDGHPVLRIMEPSTTN